MYICSYMSPMQHVTRTGRGGMEGAEMLGNLCGRHRKKRHKK